MVGSASSLPPTNPTNNWSPPTQITYQHGFTVHPFDIIRPIRPSRLPEKKAGRSPGVCPVGLPRRRLRRNVLVLVVRLPGAPVDAYYQALSLRANVA